MTRQSLKALWFGGGGLLATWLAVSPNGAPPVSPAQQSATAAAERTSESLNAEADLLRLRTSVAMRPATRNPFRFSSPKASARALSPAPTEQPMPAPAPATPAFPSMSLAGIAQNAGKRTAVITSGTQMYLVSDGETVAGALTVVRIDADAVLLRDTGGAELRLELPR